MKAKIILLVISILLFSCSFKKDKDKVKEYEYRKVFVIGKTESIVDSNTKYLIAYSDGTDSYVGYGMYVKLEYGDSILWRREKGGYLWYMIYEGNKQN